MLFFFIPWITRFRWPVSSGGLHSTVRGITETLLAVTLQRRFPNPLLVNVLGG
jgi:hypothetical protein